ncbi:ABC transporter permease [Phyllobacterium endophyticum]|uniref:ABC transporter permease n=1 Tax=Phyllobacterium endophyticum TaxID=1149773 RepID=UPI0011C96888|nr:ABC transporter permease [Phyllobacterium endophyticum]TXR50539.1 ABC transporter permease [Phyllobacterium endophyticum]
MKNATSKLVLLSPVVILFIVFVMFPMLTVLDQSFRVYEPGRIGASAGAPLTIASYAELLVPVYARYFATTYLLAFCASLVAISVASPVAYYIARCASSGMRKIWISGLIGLMFLSALVRIYGIQLTFGSVGILAPLISSAGINLNGNLYINVIVIIGLLQYAIPMSTLILIGVIQNLNPRLTEAAQSLGASEFESHLTVTIPLCIRGLLSAFLVSMTLGISAFAIPWILGRGRVLFISNLIYSRFSDSPNFSSGAAISIVMLALSTIVIAVLSKIATALDRS